MEEPFAKKDLVESILELRAQADRLLMRNKYYVAIKKLDELLEAIRPLEAEGSGEELRGAADAAEPIDETAAGAQASDYPAVEAEPQPQYAAAAAEPQPQYAAAAAEPQPQAAAAEPQPQYAAAGAASGLAYEAYQPGATSAYEEPPYEQPAPMQAAPQPEPAEAPQELSVLDVAEEAQPEEASVAATARMRPRADAAE